MIRTTFTLLKNSSAQQSRVGVLARSLGGYETYGMDTPITLEQIAQSNGQADADWVKSNNEVHLKEDATSQAPQATEEKVVKITKKLEEALVEVTSLPDCSVSSTVNNGVQLRTTTIRIKSKLGSELENALADLEKART